MEELTIDQAMAFIGESDVAHLAVVDAGEPYVTPVSFVLIEATMYFRTGAGRRLTALRSGPSVCVEVSEYDVETGSWKSVIAHGEALVVEDDQVAQVVVGALLNKYSRAIGSPLSRGGARPLPEPGVIVGIELGEVTGRTSGSWFSLPTRPGRL